MINLLASDLLQVVTGGTPSVVTEASWSDTLGTTYNPGRLLVSIASATTTTIAGSPAAGYARNVETVRVTNADATFGVVVTVQHTDGTTAVNLWGPATLQVGWSVTYSGEAWVLVDDSGRRRQA